jgi:hypothetical protein
MSTDTRSARLHKLITTPDRQWFGHLTLENFDAVAERITSMLTGKRFTWVACNSGLGNYFPEVRTGQQLREGITVHERKTYEDGSTYAHLSVADTYGVWGLSTDVPDDEAAENRRRRAWDAASEDARKSGEWEDKRLTWVKIERGHYDAGRIEITHFALAGHRLYWVIAVEPERDDDA